MQNYDIINRKLDKIIDLLEDKLLEENMLKLDEGVIAHINKLITNKEHPFTSSIVSLDEVKNCLPESISQAELSSMMGELGWYSYGERRLIGIDGKRRRVWVNDKSLLDRKVKEIQRIYVND